MIIFLTFVSSFSSADSTPSLVTERKTTTPHSFRIENHPAGWSFSIDSLLDWIFGGRSKKPSPREGLSSAQMCFNCLKYTFECDDESQFSRAWQMGPLDRYINRLFKYVGAQSAFVETIILFFHRYWTSGIVNEKMIAEGQVHGHAVFIAAFMAAFRIHYERPETRWKINHLVNITQLPLNVLDRLRGAFEGKIRTSGPLTKIERKTLVPIFCKLRQNSAYFLTPSATSAHSVEPYYYATVHHRTKSGKAPVIDSTNGQTRSIINVAPFVQYT